MKSLVLCVSKVLADAETWCCVSTRRDLKTITERVNHEGLSFLTITLPSFSKSFERSLELGRLDSNSFQGFRFDQRGFPRFLGGFLRLVFDPGSCTLLDKPDASAIFFIRQITNLAKKLKLECSPSRKRKAFTGYVECENEVARWVAQHDPVLDDQFRDAATLLFGTSVVFLGRKVRELQHVPRHGPGATAEKLSANGRYSIKTWNNRLEPFFPSDYFAVSNFGDRGALGRIDFVEPGMERPSRLISVPKTLKTPRLISIEPACMQYTQQSLLELFVPELESRRYFGSLGFLDQSINRALAQKASKDKSLATLDLSEASDRVSNHLVKLLLASDPDLSDAVQACRSQRVDVLGNVLNVAKFASMGSALCFPIEAMVFLTILRVADCKRLGVQSSSRKGLKAFLKRVRVYGDDIIIPTDLTQLAIESLEAYGLKVNSDKSFWKSNFRESCGGDYFDGVDVKPIYLRSLPEMAFTSNGKREALISLVSTRNQLYQAGLWQTCAYLDKVIEKEIPFPIVAPESPIQGRFSFLHWVGERVCPNLHRPLVRGLVLKPRGPNDALDGPGALLKYFLKRGNKPRDKMHLVRYGRPRYVNTNIGWSTPY